MRTACVRALAALLLLLPLRPAAADYILTPRDTGLPEPPAAVAADIDPEAYAFLGRFGDLEYYFRDDRDIFAVIDMRSGYIWKTGIDVPFNNDIDRAISEADTEQAKLAAAIPKERELNATYIAFANSLLTAEYYDDANNLARVSSAAQRNAASELAALDAASGRYCLDVQFTGIDLAVKVYITLTGQGLRYYIPDEALTGTGMNALAALILTPFLGASGGMQECYNPETNQYDIVRRKPMIPGYIMIPDGPGALVRFRENSVPFKKYIGKVYGENPADASFYTSEQLETVPAKEPSAPVFGIAHGDRQAAFVFWADGGDAYLELTVSPEANITRYHYAYPRFVYNQTMYQMYNRMGAGYMRLYPERNHMDISASYMFLAGDGKTDGLPADYTGMALAYRARLIETGRLSEKPLPEEMPLHVDFIMSDFKKDLFFYRDMVTTTAAEAGAILRDLAEAGVRGINAGLMGAQKGGVTGGKPWTLNFSRAIGSSGEFAGLIGEMNALGTDIYFTQDYASINSRQMPLGQNMAYHRSNWGVRRLIQYNNTGVPVTEISFAKPQKSAEWLLSQTDIMKRLGAVSVGLDGISGRLTSHYGRDAATAEDAIRIIRSAVIQTGLKISAYTPNLYLWDVTDRFINTPLMTTQYIIQTDTVPFLPMVLNGAMELYGPYANFSFYSRSDILRMIDYNVFPSFVLTERPAYLLADTNSAHFYSTSYALYRDTILAVYREMSAVYRRISGQRWTGRDVIAPGVIMNAYSGGTRVLINYTDEPAEYQGHRVSPLSAAVWEEEGA